MIHIEQGQRLKSDPKIKVAVPTGDYNETDLIECYPANGNPNQPTCMYQAQCVVFGSVIYQQSEELTEDQVAALLANRPADEVINNRKLIDGKIPAAKYIGMIVKVNGLFGLRRLRTDISFDEPQTIIPPDDVTIVPDPEPTNPTTTPPTTLPPVNTSTTTPVVDIDDTPTTTPPVTNFPPVSTSTTPVIIEPVSDSDIPVSAEPGTKLVPEPTAADVIDAIDSAVEVLTNPTATTTDAIVSYAKRKIAKKLSKRKRA